MPETDARNSAFSWSTLFVRTLFEQGVEHAVISPGSRSTALTLAFANHPGFKKHIIIDERSAAFTALGIGKASGKPAVLVCTSGTAVANYLPAVIEARQAGVPLIVASADRPPKYRGTGASQTIDQLKLFGDYTVSFHEAGEPDASEEGQKRLKSAVIQACTRSVEQEGVAHINLAFSKPFEPSGEFLKQVKSENEKHAKRHFPTYEIEQGKMRLDERFWSDLISAEKPVIVVGPTSFPGLYDFISELSEILKAPVLAEPGSNIPFTKNMIEGFDGFLRNEENRGILKSDLILRFGSQPVSKALNQYLTEMESAMQICFMNPNHWSDGTLNSDKQIQLHAVLEIPEVTGSAKFDWLQTWKKAEDAFKSEAKNLMPEKAPLTDGYVFRQLSASMPKKCFTMLSNSFPVRDMSMFGAFAGKEMYVNRGAAGIDGINSTAIGLSAALHKPGVLFVGDIAFLHDSNALMNARLVQKPLVIVVLNNGGGTIFRMLPVHDLKDEFETYFETPQQVAISALCRAHKIEHTLVSRPGQLVTSFQALIKKNGVHVLECMTEADDSMELRQELWNFSLQNE